VRRRVAFVVCAAVALVTASCRARVSTLRASIGGLTSDGAVAIDVAGLSAAQLDMIRGEPTSFVQLRLLDGRNQGALGTPVAGRSAVYGQVARFRPAYPLVEGASYVVSIRSRERTDVVVRVPTRAHATPYVDSVFPTAGAVPENLLKFYVRFSTPMRRGFADTHVALLDETGHVVSAFLRRDAELWDTEDRTLTMLLDPARVKTGLRANTRLGRALRAGHPYRLVVLAGWPSADGVPLGRSYVKQFRATREDRTRLDEKRWRLVAPNAGTRRPLSLRFGEALDRLLLEASLAIVDRSGERVPGVPFVAADEREWRFVPDHPWRQGDYYVDADPTLADLAGNDLVESFDRPSTERPRRASIVRVPFTVMPTARRSSIASADGEDQR
jgi:hypothetical protein